MGNYASHNIKSTMDKCSASHYTSWFTGVSFMYASWLLVAFAEGREHCMVRRPLSGPLHGDISAPVFPLFCVILCVCVKVTICHICHLHWLQVRELLEWVSEAPFCSFPRCWTGAPPLFATPGGRKAASQLALSKASSPALSEFEASPLRRRRLSHRLADQCTIWRHAKVPWTKLQKKPLRRGLNIRRRDLNLLN